MLWGPSPPIALFYDLNDYVELFMFITIIVDNLGQALVKHDRLAMDPLSVMVLHTIVNMHTFCKGL